MDEDSREDIKCGTVRLRRTVRTAGRFGLFADVVITGGIGLLLVWVKMPKRWLGIGRE